MAGEGPRVVELDWNAVQAIGTILAAVIAVVAFSSSRRAAEAERRRNEAQDRVDAEQQGYIMVVAESIRRIAEQQDAHVRALADRVAELEAKRDPSGAEKRRAERAREEAAAKQELAELGTRLEKITVLRRDGMAGGGWSANTLDQKRIIRFSSRPKAKESKCEECGTALNGAPDKCPECGHPVSG